MGLTLDFLGPPASWPDAQVHLRDVHALWGGRNVFLRGDGRIVVQAVSPGQHETRTPLTATPAEAQALLGLIAAHDLLALTFPPRPVIPDESLTTLILVNARGQRAAVSKWAHDEHAGFQAAAANLLNQLCSPARTAGQLPSYSGPYDPEFIPDFA